MGLIKFPGPGPFKITAEYLADNRDLFAKYGYDLSAVRSEAELSRALELISTAEWGAVSDRMAAAAKDSNLQESEREFWSDVAPGQTLKK